MATVAVTKIPWNQLHCWMFDETQSALQMAVCSLCMQYSLKYAAGIGIEMEVCTM